MTRSRGSLVSHLISTSRVRIPDPGKYCKAVSAAAAASVTVAAASAAPAAAPLATSSAAPATSAAAEDAKNRQGQKPPQKAEEVSKQERICRKQLTKE